MLLSIGPATVVRREPRVRFVTMSPQSNAQSSPDADGGTVRPDPDAERHVHIVLLGLMGAGKTTVGHLVANEIGRPFVDSDSMVELRTGHAPPRLVDAGGLDELHAAELEVLRHVMEHRDSVVLAAAASVVDVVTPDDLAGAWCVWLETDPEALARRVAADHHERPLVGERPAAVLADQHARRSARGQELASFVIRTDDRSAADVAAGICAAWRKWARS